jgi:hypothetical protein
MAKDIHQAVREVCLWLPESAEHSSHGWPNFRVRGKTFATYVVNHHGDGRTALWLNAPAGAQELYVGAEPRHFFVPPYVGPRGWLGVNLDSGLSWTRIAALVREAYEKAAPGKLAASIGKTVRITPPKAALKASELDPWRSKRGEAVLSRLRRMVLEFPEVLEAKQFGRPAWQAGKRTFAIASHRGTRLELHFWVGIEQQGLLSADGRYRIPAHSGHNGWIALDVTRHGDWGEIKSLAGHSYRHFALRRMREAMGATRRRGR